MKKHKYLILLLVISTLLCFFGDQTKTGFKPVVKVDESVYRYEPANNGAGPIWCHGNTCIVRFGDEVFASGLETIKDAKPLLKRLYRQIH